MPDGTQQADLAAHIHPYAEMFPLIEGVAFHNMVEDIRQHGLQEPIVQYQDAILDGRNRYRACLAAGVEPRFVEFSGTDPLAAVLSANLERRHLSETQRAMIAVRLETMSRGRPRRREKDAPLHLSRSEAAKRLHVSSRSVADAKEVRDKGTPGLIAKTEQGNLPVSLAAKVAKLPESEQQAVVTKTKDEIRLFLKRDKRARRETELAAKAEAAATNIGNQLYSVILADPPWRLEPYSHDTGLDQAANNHYPTMETTALAQIILPAADDAVLFMWATAPMLAEALWLMNIWRFVYRSHLVWTKDRAGTGYWFRSQHELLLVGTRGTIPAPAPGEQHASVLEAPVGEHNAKPFAVTEMINQMFPSCTKLEMFPRGPVTTGWHKWGNDADA